MPWYIRFLRGAETALFLVFFGAILEGSTLLIPTSSSGAVHIYTRPVEFDFVSWTADALGIKIAQASIDSPYYFDAASRHQIVVEYMHLIDSILKDENRLDLFYTDPSIHDPQEASSALRASLQALYARQRKIGPLAESILQEQVAATLAEEGLTTDGQPVPPVLFHITPLPYNLVVSPRDKIQEDASISLIPDLTVDQQVILEGKVDKNLNVSSLVVPIGGIGSYPTMIERTTALDWLSSTIAHEWTHNWLTLHPLGLNYDTTPELRTMNETTADIVGGEVGKLVLQHYYPELAAEYSAETVSLPLAPARADFNFNAEMHTTRVEVDALLAQGKITEAEAYMEQRRLFFWQNGYPIRKLNQAYFAFYGAYADVPGGAAGEDPVGPAVRALRARSASLAIFLKRIAAMSSFKQLQEAVGP
ncbi:MAG TPA: hypothetical protein VMC09_08880 [Anaerolineales bacterium]|nr:hypothetical protein [Anaerolineales bacterium]